MKKAKNTTSKASKGTSKAKASKATQAKQAQAETVPAMVGDVPTMPTVNIAKSGTAAIDGKPVNVVGIVTPDNETGTKETVAEDLRRAADETVPLPPDMELRKVELPNELTATEDSGAWNRARHLVPHITLTENNVLAKFDYVPTQCRVGGKVIQANLGTETAPDWQPVIVGSVVGDYKQLVCSDNGAVVGEAYKDSYGLVGTAAILKVVENIVTGLEKLGIKSKIVTTGTLMCRERMFISIKIEQADTFKIEGREFKTFLNILNSIPSSKGCKVTFANNTFCVCCENTFAHALTGENGSQFHATAKHTKNIFLTLGDIEKMFQAFVSGNDAMLKNLKRFHEYPISVTQAEQFFAAFIGQDLKGELTDKTELSVRSANIIERLKELHVRGRGNKGETALDMFSAVTEYFTHFSAGKSDNPNKQAISSEIGDGYVSKLGFYQWLIHAINDKKRFDAVVMVGDKLMVAYRTTGKGKPKTS